MFLLKNPLKRRPRLSKTEATRVAEVILPIYLANQSWFSADQATILYQYTRKDRNYWELAWNNKRYAKTNSPHDAWVGPGPIAVNRWNGSVRIYPSGNSLTRVPGWNNVQDEYNDDFTAEGQAWCLSVAFAVSQQEEFFDHLKQALSLTTTEITLLKERLPGPLFTGRRRCLIQFSRLLRAAKVPCKIGLYGPEIATTLEWVSFFRAESSSEALKESRDSPEIHGGWLNFQEFDCPLPEIVERYSTSPRRAFRMNDTEREARIGEMFDQCVISGNAMALGSLFSYADNVDVNRRIQRVGGDTALLIAAHNGYKEVIELLRFRADKAITDQQGRNARDIAMENGYAEIAELLRDNESED